MLKAFKKLWNDERGNMIVIAAASLPLLIGSAGLATDTIQWALWKRQLQRAADSAAIAGVYDRFEHDGESSATSDAVNYDVGLNLHTIMTLESGYPVVSFPANAGSNKNQVRVQLAVQKSLSFSSMLPRKSSRNFHRKYQTNGRKYHLVHSRALTGVGISSVTSA